MFFNNIDIIIMKYEIKNKISNNDYLIINKYVILNNKSDEFHFVIYYLSNCKIKIIIRKLNNSLGWNNDLDIKLYDNELKKYEIISIGSSTKNYKIINYETSINIIKKEYNNQLIPKIIIQTNKSNETDDLLLINSILTFQELNPEYEYRYFNDVESRNFIYNNFEKKILEYYDKLIPGAFKADFFRYCYLYKFGGCYFDCKNILKIPLSDIIEEDDDIILCQDLDEDCFYNSIIMTKANNEIFMEAINKIIYNIDNFNFLYDKYKKQVTKKKPYYGTLNITGPNLLYKSSINKINYKKNVKLIHVVDGDYSNYRNLKIMYNNKLFALKNYSSWKPSGSHYNKLWLKKEVIYYDEFK